MTLNSAESCVTCASVSPAGSGSVTPLKSLFGVFATDVSETSFAMPPSIVAPPKVVGSAGLWGLAVAKGDEDAAGVDVTKVFPNGPAAAGGLKVGDRVLTIDGRWTDSVADAYLAASLVKPGRAVEVVLKRDGKERTVNVTPAKGY